MGDGPHGPEEPQAIGHRGQPPTGRPSASAISIGDIRLCVNTTSFTGYPDGRGALLEMQRVLKEGGRIVMVDINDPKDRNPIGMQLVRIWAAAGDLIRDMGTLFETSGFQDTDREVGGFGSVHLYVATNIAEAP